MADLALGDAVTLSPKHFTGEVVFKLTTTQLKRLEKAMAAGRGCQLKLSAAQIKHMAQKGSGKFTDLLRSGVNYVKPIVQTGVAKGAQGAEYVSDQIQEGSKYVRKKLGMKGKGFIGRIGKKLAHGAIDVAGDMMGIGAKPANRRPTGPARHAEPLEGGSLMGTLGKIRAVGGLLGLGAMPGAIPNPNANTNEGLRAAMFQKKVPVAVGSGLKW